MGRKNTANYAYGSVSFFLIFTAWAIWWGFFQIWLTSSSSGIMLNGAQVGTFFSIYSIATVIVLFLYGALQDKLDLKRNILIFVSLVAACNGPFAMWILRPLLQSHLVWGAVIGSVFFTLGFAGAMALCEAYFGRFCVRTGIAYGRMRMWGSFGYALALLSAGFLFTINPFLIFWVSSVLGIILFFAQVFWKVNLAPAQADPAQTDAEKTTLSDQGTAASSVKAEKIHDSESHKLPDKSDGAKEFGAQLTMLQAICFVMRKPKLWAIMLFSLLTWSMYQIFESQMFPEFFTSWFSNAAQGQRIFGLYIGILTILETLLMSLVPLILARFGAKKTLLAASLVMFTITAGAAAANSVLAVMAAKAFHPLMIPLLVLGLMEYITVQFDLRLTATVYLVGYYVTSYAGNIIFSQPFGILRDLIGYQGVFMIFACCTLLGFFVVLFMFQDDRQSATYASRQAGHK